ncbi:hypothetical protein K443DRAFT_13669 [Laccaria amethystina LaAM-08-1]|uniref:Unplaced genomic scaffold K443scaffold_382, whole genome shotgun sequence n=1 Tax=Laccaria amethystina LaAM-08-1 TaxID=1095629 RepID=A0A0C9X7F5_9AGAR|nr:hypothetical protein K443DRAFT_13669 [Laccaria amethystina LaAM-08-1]
MEKRLTAFTFVQAHSTPSTSIPTLASSIYSATSTIRISSPSEPPPQRFASKETPTTAYSPPSIPSFPTRGASKTYPSTCQSQPLPTMPTGSVIKATSTSSS